MTAVTDRVDRPPRGGHPKPWDLFGVLIWPDLAWPGEEFRQC